MEVQILLGLDLKNPATKSDPPKCLLHLAGVREAALDRGNTVRPFDELTFSIDGSPTKVLLGIEIAYSAVIGKIAQQIPQKPNLLTNLSGAGFANAPRRVLGQHRFHAPEDQ